MTEMDRLVEAVSNSPELQRKLTVEPSDLDAAVTAAREAGYAVTRDEIVAYVGAMQESSKNALSDAQLDSVAGGKQEGGSIFFPFRTPNRKPK